MQGLLSEHMDILENFQASTVKSLESPEREARTNPGFTPWQNPSVWTAGKKMWSINFPKNLPRCKGAEAFHPAGAWPHSAAQRSGEKVRLVTKRDATHSTGEMWVNWYPFLVGKKMYHLVMINSLLLKIAIKILDLSIQKMVDLSLLFLAISEGPMMSNGF